MKTSANLKLTAKHRGIRTKKGKTRPTVCHILLMQNMVATTKGETGIGFSAKSGYWSRRTLLICVYFAVETRADTRSVRRCLLLILTLQQSKLARIQEVSAQETLTPDPPPCCISCAYAKCQENTLLITEAHWVAPHAHTRSVRWTISPILSPLPGCISCAYAKCQLPEASSSKFFLRLHLMRIHTRSVSEMLLIVRQIYKVAICAYARSVRGLRWINPDRILCCISCAYVKCQGL